MNAAKNRRVDWLGAMLCLLLPAVLLGESLFTSGKFLPYDIAEFPPIAQTLSAAELAAVRSRANYDATEAPIWFQSEIRLAREAIERGQLPHWNPYVRAGAPMLAHGHLGLLNPLHWPALAFADPADGLLAVTFLMFAAAGALMYGLLRSLRLGRSSAAFGSLAFAWSGTMTANGHWFMRLEPIAMLPGMLWAILAISRSRGWRRAWPMAGLALSTAATWMSGFPQYGVPVTLLAGGLGAVLVVLELRAGTRTALGLAGWLALGFGIGLLLSMPQLLQMLLFYPLSNRPIAESLDRATRHAFAPFGFLGYLFPDAFSHPGDPTLPQDAAPLPYLWSDLHHWQTGERLLPNYNFTEYALFPGILPLLLGIIALFARGIRWRWIVVLGFALVWLFATGACGFYLAYHLPGIKPVPPYRFAGPACALLSILAAVGLDSLRQGMRPWLLRGLAALFVGSSVWCAVAALGIDPSPTRPDDPWLVEIVDRYRDVYSREFGIPAEQITPEVALEVKFSPRDRAAPEHHLDAFSLARKRWRNNLWHGALALLGGAAFALLISLRRRPDPLRGWPMWLAFAVTAAELVTFGWKLNRAQPLEHPHDSEVHAFLRQQRDAQGASGDMLVARGSGAFGPYNLPGGTLAKEHIRDLNFYTFVDDKSDLPIRRLYGDAFILRGFVCDAFPDDERLELPWWDLCGLRYVLATEPMQHAGRRVGPHRVGDAPYYVYERPGAMPRAWVVPELRVIDDEAAAIDALLDPDLDPRAGVIVDRVAADLLGKPAAPTTRAGQRTVRVRQNGNKRITIDVTAGDPGYLVLNDTFFPGWIATISGVEVPIARGNLFQKVIRVPYAHTRIELHFHADGFVPGSILGGLALAGLATLLATAYVRGRKPA